MQELSKFRLSATARRPQLFDFERASLVFFAQRRRFSNTVVTPASSVHSPDQGSNRSVLFMEQGGVQHA